MRRRDAVLRRDSTELKSLLRASLKVVPDPGFDQFAVSNLCRSM